MAAGTELNRTASPGASREGGWRAGNRVPAGQPRPIHPPRLLGLCSAAWAVPGDSSPLPQGSPGPARSRTQSRCRSHLSVQLPQRRHHELLELRGVRPGPAVGQLPAERRAQGSGGARRALREARGVPVRGVPARGVAGVPLTGARADSDARPHAAARAARTRPPPFPAPPGRARRPPASSTAAARGHRHHGNRAAPPVSPWPGAVPAAPSPAPERAVRGPERSPAAGGEPKQPLRLRRISGKRREQAKCGTQAFSFAKASTERRSTNTPRQAGTGTLLRWASSKGAAPETAPGEGGAWHQVTNTEGTLLSQAVLQGHTDETNWRSAQNEPGSLSVHSSGNS